MLFIYNQLKILILKFLFLNKQDFFDPALKNIFINCGLDSVSSNDISFMLLNLIDDVS